jgi:hypothetical protein
VADRNNDLQGEFMNAKITPQTANGKGTLPELLRNPAVLHELLSNDPALAAELRQLQDEVKNAWEALTSATVDAQKSTTSGNSFATESSSMSFMEIKIAAQKREARAKASTDMAKNLSLGVMINATNPNWDPGAVTTYSDPEESVLLALLEADLSNY